MLLLCQAHVRESRGAKKKLLNMQGCHGSMSALPLDRWVFVSVRSVVGNKVGDALPNPRHSDAPMHFTH